MKNVVSKQGAIQIPGELRKKYNLRAGTKVVIVDYGDVPAMVPAVKNPIKNGRGFLEGKPSMSDDLKKNRELEKSGRRDS